LIYLQKRRAGISCLPFTLIVYWQACSTCFSYQVLAK
jgi:hypothetical protein